MAIIKVTSPQAVGSVKLKVTGRSKLILVNGHWNRVLNIVNMSPGEAGKKYWSYFFTYRGSLDDFINAAKEHFKDKKYQDEPYYADGSSLLGGDQSGNDRKIKGYKSVSYTHLTLPTIA